MDYKKELLLDVLTYENAILGETLNKLPTKYIPHGYIQVFSQDKEAYRYHRHQMIRYVAQYRGVKDLYNEFLKIENEIQVYDEKSNDLFRTYLKSNYNLNKLVDRLKNIREQFKTFLETGKEKIELTQDMLNYYVAQYEISEYLEVLMIICMILKGSSVDTSLNKFRDKRNSLKKGMLVDYIAIHYPITPY